MPWSLRALLRPRAAYPVWRRGRARGQAAQTRIMQGQITFLTPRALLLPLQHAWKHIQSKAVQGRVADAPSGHWVYRVLPRRLWPYAQLARWDRPIGWQLLLWPCWWSAALAASAYARPGDPLLTLLPAPWYLVLFLIGAIAMRGAGCTYNDIVDDGHRRAGRAHPLAAAAVRPGQPPAGLDCSLSCRRWSGLSCCCSSTASPSCSASARWRSLRSIPS